MKMTDGNDLEIIITQDGSHSLIAHQFGVSYHSRYGAIQESRHVFLDAGLMGFLPRQQEIRILEIGLGTGLNALLTYLLAQKYNTTVYYEAIEAHPLPLDQAHQLNYPGQLETDPALFMQIHELPWNSWQELAPAFHLLKRHENLLQAAFPSNHFQVIYFDAFAPTAQPELWEFPILEKLFASLVPGGVLVTYCAKGGFKRDLKRSGFLVEALPGPPGKREMTRATKPA